MKCYSEIIEIQGGYKKVIYGVYTTSYFISKIKGMSSAEVKYLNNINDEYCIVEITANDIKTLNRINFFFEEKNYYKVLKNTINQVFKNCPQVKCNDKGYVEILFEDCDYEFLDRYFSLSTTKIANLNAVKVPLSKHYDLSEWIQILRAIL